MEFTLRNKCLSILDSLLETVDLLEARNEMIKSSDDYLMSVNMLEKLDANCMRLQTIGENIKRFDQITEKTILSQFTGVKWSQIIRMRDYISHHYDGVDSDVVFDIIKNDLPALKTELKKVRIYVDSIQLDEE